MSEKYLVSLLWPNNGMVLVKLAQAGRRAFATTAAYASEAIVDGLQRHGAHLRDVHAGVYGERLTQLRAEADRRVSLVRPFLDAAFGSASSLGGATPAAFAQKIDTLMRERLVISMTLLEGLDTLSKSEGIAALLLNDSETQLAKAATLWAKHAAIPTFMLTHGANLGRHYTVTGGVQPDHIMVFGERGGEAFLDDGVPAGAIRATGNPTWDGFHYLDSARNMLRERFFADTGFEPGVPVLLFATTWTPKLSALDEPRVFERTVGVFLRACARLESRGLRFNAVVKGRTANGEAERVRVERMADTTGFRSFKFMTGDMTELLPVMDAIVSYDSNVSIQAGLASVPAINLWTPTSWLLGPHYGASDGLAAVRYDQPEELAALLERVLTEESFRGKLVERLKSRAPYFHIANDGQSASRVAEYILAKLAAPRRGANRSRKAGDPRHELIALFRHDPERVIDVGGGGATGCEIKIRFTNAEVISLQMNPDDAQWTAKRVDRVFNEDAETIDWAANGIAHGSVDTILFPDSLAQMREPWQTLARVKPYLRSDAQLLAGIPNARNLWLISQLAKGFFSYEDEGLLDAGNLRFFTLYEVHRLFREAGYEIEVVGQIVDPRAQALEGSAERLLDVQTDKLVFKQMSMQDVQELKTLKFLVRARPVHHVGDYR